MLKKQCLIFNMVKGRSGYGELRASMMRRIRGKGPDWAFTPGDFADLGDPRSVGMVLTRLVKDGKIRRVQRGLYEVPHRHPIAGVVGASVDGLVKAVARRDALKLLPSGAMAANSLGLSTQVPAVLSYGTVGTSRTVTIGRGSVRLRKRSPKMVALGGRISGWLAEALRNLGRGQVRPEDLRGLRAKLSAADRRQLLKDLRYVPAWMRPLFIEVARDE